MTNAESGLFGSRVVVVGALGGIGSAIVRRLVAAQAHIVGWDANEAAADVSDFHGIVVDCSDEAGVSAAAAATIEHLGSVDALVIASGTTGRGWMHETVLAEWRRVVDNNLTATFLILRAILPHMLDRGGAVVTIGSTAS